MDTAHHLFGIRLNDYVAATVFALASAYLVVLRRRPSDPVGYAVRLREQAGVPDTVLVLSQSPRSLGMP